MQLSTRGHLSHLGFRAVQTSAPSSISAAGPAGSSASASAEGKPLPPEGDLDEHLVADPDRAGDRAVLLVVGLGEARARRLLGAGRHKTIATLRADGSPVWAAITVSLSFDELIFPMGKNT